MPSPTDRADDADGAASAPDEQQALLAALRALVGPLARLAVARGVPHAVMEELLKQGMVRAAAAAHPGIAPHRSVSRIATATGINRREVTRLVLAPAETSRGRSRSIANDVFTHWLSDKTYCDGHGRPLALRRQGPVPSFESLAHSVTRDVHPRSLLDEMLRLRMAVIDEESDTVRVHPDGWVPSGDAARMLAFLGDNVGDHLSASIDNFLGDGRRHFEQALFADGLSPDSLAAMKPLVTAQWKALMQALVPALEARLAQDEALPAAEHRRVRIGLYAYDDASPSAPATATPDAAPAASAPRRRARKAPARGMASPRSNPTGEPT